LYTRQQRREDTVVAFVGVLLDLAGRSLSEVASGELLD
jgi:hypothetical protein